MHSWPGIVDIFEPISFISVLKNLMAGFDDIFHPSVNDEDEGERCLMRMSVRARLRL